MVHEKSPATRQDKNNKKKNQCQFEARQQGGSEQQRQKGDTERQMDRLTDQSRQVNRRANTAGAIPQRAMTQATASRPGKCRLGELPKD